MSRLADARRALREWRRDPTFALVAVGVPGLGIALFVAALALVNAYLVRPLPFPAADRVHSVRLVPEGADWSILPSRFDEVEWTGLETVASEVGSWDLDVFTILGDAGPEQVRGAWVTPALLRIVGARPALGRLLTDADVADGARVAVIGHDLWQRRYGGRPDVIGAPLQTFSSDRPEETELFEVVGVLPADFWHLNRFTEVLTPLAEGRTPYLLELRDGVTPAAAGARLTDLVRAQRPETDPEWRISLVPTQQQYASGVQLPLFLILAAAALVLVVACGNVGVLLLVRATRRERELDIRRALGAGRGAIARQLLTEGLLLAAAAGAVGAALAVLGLDVGGPMVADRLGVPVPGGTAALGVDPSVLLATALAIGLVGTVFGMIPLVTTGRTELAASLRSRRGGHDTPRRRRMRKGLLVAEVAVSMALLLTAGLVVRSALNVRATSVGFEPRRAMVAGLQLRVRSYPEPERRLQLFAALRDGVAALPEVEAVGFVAAAPFTYRFSPTPVEAQGGVEGRAVVNAADAGFRAAIGLRLAEGRWFEVADRADAAPVAVISAGLARTLLPDRPAIGAMIRVRDPQSEETPPWRRVVGVVADVRKTLTDVHHPDLWVPIAQETPVSPDLVVRAGADPLALVPRIADVIRHLDPTVPLAEPRALADLVADELAGPDFLAALVAAFSALALLLAGLGLYGVVAYSVRLRRRDVAIRMALGAAADAVVRGFVREGAAVVGAGLGLGLLAGAAGARLLAHHLHGVAALEPALFLGLALLLGTVGLAAAWLPARRAARTEPSRILRED